MAAMSFAITLSSPFPSSSSRAHHHHNYHRKPSCFSVHPKFTIQSYNLPLFQTSRGTYNFPPARSNIVDDPRNWSRSEFVNDEDDDEEDGDEEEEDRSLDLLVRFVQNMFKKVSKRARKAVRSVLPVPISAKLVSFSVDGVLMLAFLWVFKAFLEVVCTLGSVVFVSILLVRVTWSGVTYLQESRNFKMNGLGDDNGAWTGSQPAT